MDALRRHGRDHTKKYLEATLFGDELAFFWGDYSAMRDYPPDSESWEDTYARQQEQVQAAAFQANLAKQRGFYVDRDESGTLHRPTRVEAGTTAADLQTAAQVVEMLLIRDHSRMQLDAHTPYDSTHDQQLRLLPISHPQDWAAATEGIEAGQANPKGEAQAE